MTETAEREFDFVTALDERADGMEAAAARRRDTLRLAQRLAVEIARARGDRLCWADLVQARLQAHGLSSADLGNAAGSIFTRSEWEFTGDRVRSARVAGHGNEQKVWRLK